jgi:predicted kinase
MPTVLVAETALKVIYTGERQIRKQRLAKRRKNGQVIERSYDSVKRRKEKTRRHIKVKDNTQPTKFTS